MQNVCLIDIDDTLGDLKNPMMYALNKHTGKNFHWSDWKEFDIPKIYDITCEQFFEYCQRENVLSNIKPHDEAHAFLKNLRKLNTYIVLITARGWHPNGEAITCDWINEHELDIDELIIIPEHGNKADVIKKFNNIMFSVDDRIRNCRDYMNSELVDKVFIYTAPWNSHMNNWNHVGGGFDYHYRIRNLNDIFKYDYLGGLGTCTQKKLVATG